VGPGMGKAQRHEGRMPRGHGVPARLRRLQPHGYGRGALLQVRRRVWKVRRARVVRWGRQGPQSCPNPSTRQTMAACPPICLLACQAALSCLLLGMVERAGEVAVWGTEGGKEEEMEGRHEKVGRQARCGRWHVAGRRGRRVCHARRLTGRGGAVPRSEEGRGRCASGRRHSGERRSAQRWQQQEEAQNQVVRGTARREEGAGSAESFTQRQRQRLLRKVPGSGIVLPWWYGASRCRKWISALYRVLYQQRPGVRHVPLR